MARATDADRPRPTRRSQAGSRRDDCLDAAHYRTDEPAGVAVHANVRSRHTPMNTAWMSVNEGTLLLRSFFAFWVSSEQRHLGKVCVSTCITRCCPVHYKTINRY